MAKLRLIKRPQVPEISDKYYNIPRYKTVDKEGGGCYPVSEKRGSKYRPDGRSDPNSQRTFDKRKWLNVRELAEYLGTTPSGIRGLVYREKIVAYKPFGMLLFNKDEIDRYIESKRALAWYEKDRN